jgi:ABC-type multidrug transport system fused ATPase/permease subunit
MYWLSLPLPPSQIIAHRQSTIRKAQTGAVLRDGRIIESGSYETLMARPDSELAAVMSSNDDGLM